MDYYCINCRENFERPIVTEENNQDRCPTCGSVNIKVDNV